MDAVKSLCDLSTPEKGALVADWEAVLNDLETDPMRCRDRVDWVAKLALIREFQTAQNISDSDPWLRSLDLEYHRLDEEEGLYYGLEKAGAMRLVPDEAEVVRGFTEPPPSTRAYFRGRCVQKFTDAIISAQWDHVTVATSDGPLKISLLDLFAPADVLRYREAVDAAQSPDDLRTLGNVSS